jgi:hypothetical protein
MTVSVEIIFLRGIPFFDFMAFFVDLKREERE